MGYCFNRYAVAGLVPNDCHKNTTHFVTHLCRTVAFSIHIDCNVHTNNCFFDTSRQRVDGVDIQSGK